VLAGLGVHGPTTTAARIRNEHVDPAPLLDDPRDPCLDRLMVTDIDLDSHGSAADASILATVLSAVMSLVSASNSSYERRFRTAESPFPL
jgi:hypothetical protein